MRVSTGMIYDAGLASMQTRTGSLLRSQQQLAEGRRILRPSDDPVAAARALEVTQAKDVNANQATARDNATSTLALAESQLQSAGDLMVRLRELTVQAGNASLSSADRRSLANELRVRFEEMVALANSRDGTGLYLFGGYQTNNQPFAGSVEHGVAYSGDDGARMLRVSGSRELAISDSGNDLFMRVKNGNGVFATSTQYDKPANSSQVTVTSSTVTTAAAWNDGVNSGNLEVRFWVDKTGALGNVGETYYDLVDTSVLPSGVSLLTNAAPAGAAAGYMRSYTSGMSINFSGLNAAFNNPSAGGVPTFGASLVASGVPADGDVLAVTRPIPGAIAVDTDGVATSHSGAVIDNGAVTDPVRWASSANSQNLEVRFWVDTAGGVTTPGQAVGSIAPTLPLILTGLNNQFTIDVDGLGVQTATVAAATYNTLTDVKNAVQSAIDTALGVAPPLAGSATVTTDVSGRLVVTSASPGAGSSVALSNGPADALPSLFGAPVSTAGATSAAGTTFYDLVDAGTGKSVFTDTASTTGVGGTYSHRYVSGAPISFSSVGGGSQVAFNFGAEATVTGTVATGDAFTIKGSADTVLGNGFFVTDEKKATAVNTGSGVIGAGEVRDITKWNQPANSRNLEVRFWKDTATDPAKLYYDLVDVETEKSLFTGTNSTAGGGGNTFTHAFVSGDAIPFSGLNVTDAGPPPTTVTDFGISVVVSGTPASGDRFKIQPSTSESVFDTMGRLITSLENGAPTGTAGNTHLSNELGTVLTSIGQIEDNFLRGRAAIGSRMAEIEDLNAVGENLDLKYAETLSNLQDLDYAEAITRLTRQQTELQAAQQSFARISQMSLFDYLG